jgi:hypothetical protein
MFVVFPTLEHATYSCPCEKHGSQCCHTVCETFPRKYETGFEGQRRFHVNTEASDTHTHTHTHTHIHINTSKRTHIHVTLRVGSIVSSSR